VRCDYPGIRELRTQRSTAGCAKAGKRAKLTGISPAAFPTVHRVSSFFDSGTRAAGLALAQSGRVCARNQFSSVASNRDDVSRPRCIHATAPMRLQSSISNHENF
jgi:hypothetical protein